MRTLQPHANLAFDCSVAYKLILTLHHLKHNHNYELHNYECVDFFSVYISRFKKTKLQRLLNVKFQHVPVNKEKESITQKICLKNI